MQHRAVFSPCGRYRYVLRRTWDPSLPTVLFIALNPSTADQIHDDPTIRRCIGFARSWGFGNLTVANFFALRATNPAALKHADDPIGPANNRWLRRLSDQALITIAAWGNHGSLHQRAGDVLPRLKNVHHLGRTSLGCPRHLLYLHATTLPTMHKTHTD